MNEFYIRNVVEAALLAAGKSLQPAELGQIFDESARPKTEEIRAALEVLATEYSSRAVEIKETAAGFRIQVRKEFASEISRLWPERPAKYSRALLETLALIAYRQPITRAEIEAVRGVAVNPNILKTVIERNWVRVVGHRDVPGRPELLGTTREFLDYFGLRSLDELPPLAQLKAMGEYTLQLELPNAGALGIEGSGNGAAAGEPGGGTTVVGLLAESAGAEAEGTSGGIVESVVTIADAVGIEASGDPDTRSASTTDRGGADVEAAGAKIEGPDASSAGTTGDVTTVNIAVVEFEGVELGGPNLAVADLAEPHTTEWTAGAESDCATGEDGAFVQAGELSQAIAAIDADVAIESDDGDESIEADPDDAEAERTLSEGFAANAGDTPEVDAADSDDSEAADSAASGKPTSALGDADVEEDDDEDEDELSADGHDSRELVAAPRDVDD
ncbi:MAG: segregation and condensation protein [Gammaproteobacteria bacterium]|nr:segregation and condensation protein [Gammaproteobacteria bacterium]